MLQLVILHSNCQLAFLDTLLLPNPVMVVVGDISRCVEVLAVSVQCILYGCVCGRASVTIQMYQPPQCVTRFTTATSNQTLQDIQYTYNYWKIHSQLTVL